MIPIAKEFEKNGYTHRQIKRVDDVAIYQLFNENDEPRGYEVYEIRKYPDREIGGVLYPPEKLRLLPIALAKMLTHLPL